MKKYVVIIFGLLLITGCDSKKQFEIKLEGNPSTGYEWKCTIDDLFIIREKSVKYKPDNTDLDGSGGVYTFIYEGLKEGTTKVICEYSRSFEKNYIEKTKKYTLKVDKNLNIKEK